MMFRGNYAATVDERSRIRLPSAFLTPLRETFGDELFLTSLFGDCMRIYPLKAWLLYEKKLMRIPSMNPSRAKLLGRLTFFGQEARLDKVGRVLIPQRLRAGARLEGEVAVLGHLDYLEVWNPELYLEKLEADPLTEDDRRLLSELGI
jgi:MraZ protein